MSTRLIQFVYNVAIPAAVFVIIAQEEIGTLMNGSFYLAYGGVSTVVFVAIFFGARFWRKADPGWADMLASICVAANAVIIGLPLLHGMLGHKAVIFAAMANLFVVGLFLVQVLLLELAIPDAAGAKRSLLKPIRNVLLSPVVLATVLGIVYAILPLGLPKLASDYLDLLGQALTPCALFAIGMAIKPETLMRSRGVILFVLVVKLLVLPVLVFTAARLLELDPLLTVVTVLVAALPTAKSEFVFAKQYHEHEEVVAHAVSATTALSVITLMGWMLILSRVYPGVFSPS